MRRRTIPPVVFGIMVLSALIRRIPLFIDWEEEEARLAAYDDWLRRSLILWKDDGCPSLVYWSKR